MLFLATSLTACTKTVEPGYVGMTIEATSGIKDEVLSMGRHSCWGRCKMVRFELADTIATEKLSIMCKDDLKFGFHLKVRAKLRASGSEALKDLLSTQGSKIGADNVLRWKFLYQTYVQPVARVIARDVVSKYETTEISANRKKIQADIKAALVLAVANTPMEVTLVAASDFQYPEVVTSAVDKREARKIEIGEEKAKQKMAMLRETNSQKIEMLDATNKQEIAMLEAGNRQMLAQKMLIVRATEAKAEAIYTKIAGAALTDKYLRRLEIENQRILAKGVGRGDTVYMFGGGQNTMMSLPANK